MEDYTIPHGGTKNALIQSQKREIYGICQQKTMWFKKSNSKG